MDEVLIGVLAATTIFNAFLLLCIRRLLTDLTVIALELREFWLPERNNPFR